MTSVEPATAAALSPGGAQEHPSVLTLRGVTKRYGSTAAVDGISLDLRPGEVLAMIGPSGCGKSTALRLVAGLERPDDGKITIAGDVVADRRSWTPAERRRVGLVFQDYALFPHLSVSDNVAFGLEWWSGRDRRARVGDVLDMVQLRHLGARYPHELSGGEQQRVALARALAPKPAVVLLDEPFSNLDRNLRAQVRDDTVEVLRETGTTAVLVTHDQGEALAVGDRILVMRDGRIEQVGVPDRVFHSPENRFVATFMGEADFLLSHWTIDGLVSEAGRVEVPADVAAGRPHGLEVMVRPHEVTLAPDPVGSALVTHAEYLGAFVQYTVTLPSGRTVRSLQPHTTNLAVGSRVAVALDPGHQLTLLAGDHAVTH